MNWRDLIDVAVIHAERSTHLLLALVAVFVPVYGILGEPWLLLLPLQLTSATFIGLLAYSYLKTLFKKYPPDKRALAILLPSYSTLLGVFASLFNSIPVVSPSAISVILGSIFCLKLYSALRDYDVIMQE